MPLILLLLLILSAGAQPLLCDFKSLAQPTLTMDSLRCKASQPQMDQFEADWRNWSLEHGFLFAKLKRSKSEVVPEEWFLQADFGPMYVFEDLWPIGSTKTPTRVLLRMIGLKKGEPIQITWPQLARERLGASELFKVGKAWYARRDQRHRMVLPIEIEDLPVNEVKAQVGGTQQKWQGAVELNFPNLAYSGRSLNFALYGMENARQLNLDYMEPWLWDLNLGVKGHLDWQSKDTGAQYVNSSLEWRDFWAVPQALGLRMGLSFWQDSILKPWDHRFWTGLHYLYKNAYLQADLSSDRIWQEDNSSTRVDLVLEHENIFGSSWGLRGRHRAAWTDLELDPKVQFWDFKLRPIADFRGLRVPISSRKLLSSQKEIFFRIDLFSMGVFGDHLLRSEIREWEWVAGPVLKFKNADNSSLMRISYALGPNTAIDQGLVHLELVHRF